MALETQNDGIIICGRYFESLEELEDACFYEPELGEAYEEMRYMEETRRVIDTYYMNAENDYGDGDVDTRLMYKQGGWRSDSDY